METVSSYQNGTIVRVPIHSDPKAAEIRERTLRGYYALLPVGSVGIDMRGNTSAHVHSYVIDGRVHFLDGKTLAVFSRFAQSRRLTVLAKRLFEKRDYAWLEREYGFVPGTLVRIADPSMKNEDVFLESVLANIA